jgi:hypothetical protein
MHFHFPTLLHGGRALSLHRTLGRKQDVSFKEPPLAA